jgi:hypothetical protein
MEKVAPSERFRSELDEVLAGVGEEHDPIETVGRLGARLILQQALEDEVTEFLGRQRCERAGEVISHRNGRLAARAEGEGAIPDRAGPLLFGAYTGGDIPRVSAAALRPLRRVAGGACVGFRARARLPRAALVGLRGAAARIWSPRCGQDSGDIAHRLCFLRA